MPTRRRKKDRKNFIIGGLLIVVVVETFLLFSFSRPSKTVQLDKSIKQTKKVSLAKSPSTLKAVRVSPPLAEKSLPGQAKEVHKGIPAKTVVGRIAIIIDDAGYSKETCETLKSIEAPLTVAVLPWLEHSRHLAECVHEERKDVMLHLPLEPHWNQERYPEDYIIKTSMNHRKVERMLEEALKSVPFAIGVNNHMGSKATESKRLMTIILRRLKDKRLFFVDSVVTNQSICKNLAGRLKLNFARRDVFLDNQNSRDYIERQFAQLAKRAEKKGYAIAIGHDRPLTWQIVREQTAALQKLGFRIVSIRELLE